MIVKKVFRPLRKVLLPIYAVVTTIAVFGMMWLAVHPTVLPGEEGEAWQMLAVNLAAELVGTVVVLLFGKWCFDVLRSLQQQAKRREAADAITEDTIDSVQRVIEYAGEYQNIGVAQAWKKVHLAIDECRKETQYEVLGKLNEHHCHTQHYRIRTVKEMLRELGYYESSDNSPACEPEFVDAVRRCQSANKAHLVDGILGPETTRKIIGEYLDKLDYSIPELHETLARLGVRPRSKHEREFIGAACEKALDQFGVKEGIVGGRLNPEIYDRLHSHWLRLTDKAGE